MCSCSDNDVDAIHSDVTWTSLLTVRLNQFHFRVGLLSLFFNEFFHMVFFRNESPVFHLDMFGFHLKLESRRLGDMKTE